MFLQENLLSLVFREIGNLGDNEQLFDESQSFLLALIHDVLLSPSPENSLQEEHSHFSLNSVFLLGGLFMQFLFANATFPLNYIHVFIMPEIWC